MDKNSKPFIPYHKTKIIATIGPATKDRETIRQLILQGVNLFRLNFSHGTHTLQKEAILNIHSINKSLHTCVGILQDLQGPKIRIGSIQNDCVFIKSGQELTITQEDIIGNSERISTTYPYFINDVEEGNKILIDDGKITLKIKEKHENHVVAEVIYGGALRSNKGINLPQTYLSSPAMTVKDYKDLKFGLKHQIDWVALSFVRDAAEVIALKEIIAEHGGKAKVIAKIEKPEAIENIVEIVEASDAIMVARGDLGVEMPMEQVPLMQKKIVAKCNQSGKPVIIATQILDSMVQNPSPTRAEINDVANAVMDGADALMLSNETAVGNYPLEAINFLKNTILEVEKTPAIYYHYHPVPTTSSTFESASVIQTACRLADITNAKAILGMTQSGYTAFELSKYRPKSNIFIFTPDKSLLNKLSLVWGVRGYFYDNLISTDQTFLDIEQILLKAGHLQKGDTFITTACMPISKYGRTNMLKINIAK